MPFTVIYHPVTIEKTPLMEEFGRARMETLAKDDLDRLMIILESLKNIMISVATNGPKTKEKNNEYVALKNEASLLLDKFDLIDPNPYTDLWNWHGKWTDGSMPTYHVRRQFISDMYQELFEQLSNVGKNIATAPADEPTGWERVDRTWSKIKENMRTAKNEEDFQSIGLQCREIIISVAQVVYDPEIHISSDVVKISKTDAKRMIESYLNVVCPGSSNKEIRTYAKTAYDLSNILQHRRNATKKDALICMEVSRSVINLLNVLATK